MTALTRESARLGAADVHAFAELVARPTAAERRSLLDLLGEDRFCRLRDLALRCGTRHDPDADRGNVVVVHGLMGSELEASRDDGPSERIWLHAVALATGGLEKLRLARDGRSDAAPGIVVRPTGVLTRYYGELLLTLAATWNVRVFSYDWRKDLAIAASELETQLRAWFPDDAPVHLVAHGAGGLVARRFAAQYPAHWSSMTDAGDSRPGGRLILLGTPNHGTPAVAHLLAGLSPMVRKLAAVDATHPEQDIREVIASFPSLYQLLPAPRRRGGHALYRSGTWGDLNVPQSHLDEGLEHHRLLDPPADGRTIVVAGTGQPTLTSVDAGAPRDPAGYAIGFEGDGHVPVASAALEGARTFTVPAAHAELLLDRDVLLALPELLATGDTDRLARDAPPDTPDGDAGACYRERTDAAVRGLEELVRHQARAGEFRGSRHLGPAQEREVEDLVVAGLMEAVPRLDPVVPAPGHEPPKATIEIALVCSTIEDAQQHAAGVDALSVGHYVDVAPQAAEAALDRVLSRSGPADADVPESERLINGFTNRGVLGGRLGELFLLPDPRDRDRLVALAGMGEPGRFGQPELVVLARELCWALGRLHKRHLATVLIGAGNGNLSIEEAVEGWLRGASFAMTGSADDGEGLARITFVEEDPRKIPRIHRAIHRFRRRPGADVEYRPPRDFAALQRAAYDRDRGELEAQWRAAERLDPRGGVPSAADSEAVPTRITLSLEGDTYRYGAITEDASVPERTVPLDPELVRAANDELAAERRIERQAQRGEFLGRLLLPRDLAAHLDSNAPIVMLLDDVTARINWEMVATGPPEAADSRADAVGAALDRFLGTSRGFTRQLRTRLAPPPDPPPPPRRLLHVLVIADPAEDFPLLGAQEEGQQVVELLTSFNRVWADTPHRVEVTSLTGPHEATRTNVLRHLMSARYDVLHYAGHCAYEPDDPARSGWIFTGDKRLTSNELSRVDRIPKFVFSNACESGVTADDASGATRDLAPGFAHAFFARGVSNFVCTAWPVNDAAALEFARVLYRELLALPADGGARPRRAAAMHEAMRRARVRTAELPRGRLTWGAYQHYGNPHFRLFDRLEIPADAGAAASVAPHADAHDRALTTSQVES